MLHKWGRACLCPSLLGSAVWGCGVQLLLGPKASLFIPGPLLGPLWHTLISPLHVDAYLNRWRRWYDLDPNLECLVSAAVVFLIRVGDVDIMHLKVIQHVLLLYNIIPLYKMRVLFTIHSGCVSYRLDLWEDLGKQTQGSLRGSRAAVGDQRSREFPTAGRPWSAVKAGQGMDPETALSNHISDWQTVC